jgi:predicted MFS family arabinose efflux permease
MTRKDKAVPGAKHSQQGGAPLTRRLLPLLISECLQNVIFWAPIERLFMNELGFDAASIGLMVAGCAALVPLLSVPSGILADRWSRRAVLMFACVALLLASLIGGSSNGIASYAVSAFAMALYYALASGMTSAMVYDTVQEETGDSALFRKTLGRVRMVNSLALVASALLGGWIAQITGARTTYLLTVPFALASILALLWFSEPTLHRSAKNIQLREHINLAVRTVTRRRQLLPVITLAVLAALLINTIHEFGAFWLLDLGAPALAYGPRWACVVSALGLGGLVAGQIRLTNPLPMAASVALLLLSSIALATSHHILVVILAQAFLAVLLVAAALHVAALLHDAIPSAIRSGVSSGVDTLSWIAFLPVALLMGFVSRHHGIHAAGWIMVGLTAAGCVLLALIARAERTGALATAPVAEPETSAAALASGH